MAEVNEMEKNKLKRIIEIELNLWKDKQDQQN